MKKRTKIYILYFSVMIWFALSCKPAKASPDSLVPFGHPEVDQARRELFIESIPTNTENFLERKNTLFVWIRFLMYAGADLNSLNQEEHEGHFNIYLWRYPVHDAIWKMDYSPELAAEIDYQFKVCEDIYKEFIKDRDQYLVELKRDPADNIGEIHDWPTLRGDVGQTAYTTSPGPMQGKLHFKFPVPHAWYMRPAFDNGRVYVGSPGISYEAYCIDTKTGKIIWKTLPEGGWNPVWHNYAARSSSPALIIGEHLVIRKVQISGNFGAHLYIGSPGRQHIVFINKETGIREKGIINKGFVSSCVGHASLDGNDQYLVYPQGIQSPRDNHGSSREDYPFDSLACRSAVSGELLWEKYMGEFYAEPLLHENLVYCGNMAGELHCYNVTSGKLVWKVRTGAPINVQPAINKTSVFIGDEEGYVFSFHKKTGKQLWRQQLPKVQHAFQLFSRFTIKENNAFVGSADKNLYCFSAKSGNLKWKITLDDWIRSAPVVLNDHVFAATTSGKMFSIDTKNSEPGIKWAKMISTHPIYADLSTYQGDVYAAASNFYLINVQAETGKVNWKTSTFEAIHNEDGTQILGDLVGQPDFQSSAVVVDGIVYFGTHRFVFAVDVESGKEVWRFETRGQVSGAPAVDNGKVFFGQRGGTPNFYCLDAKSGNLVWKKRYGHVWASPNFIDGKLYLNTEGGIFMCVNENTGDIYWSFKSTSGHSYNVPCFYQNLVYFGSGHEHYALDRETGNLIWQFNIGHGSTDSATPVVKDGIFYCQGAGGEHFYANDALTGRPMWRYNINDCNVSPATDGKYIITGNLEGLLLRSPGNAHTVCLDAKTGKEIYKLPFGGLSGSAIGNNLGFTASTSDPYFKAFDLKTGEIRWRYRMGGRAEESCTTIYGNKAFIMTTDAYLYVFK
jgi:outer membrane protein assembly factor BamB